MALSGSNLSVVWVVGGLNNNYDSLFKSLERLSSGSKLNSAADGPATLIISKRLQTQIRSLGQEIDNTTASIYKYKTVSASVVDLRDSLTELRSLAVAAASGAFNSEETQAAYAQPATDAVESFNKAVANAEYNGYATLDGSEGALASLSELSGVDLSTPAAAASSIEAIDAAARELDSVMADLGSVQKYELESRLRTLRVTHQNLMAAESTLSDTDYAMEFSTYTANQIRTQVSMSLLGYSAMTSKSILSLLST